jgi:CHASE3 domain sensor protein
MEDKLYDEVYEVLDELNARIEEIVDEYQDPEVRQLVITRLQEKSREFLYTFEEELVKLDIIEMAV